MGWAPLSGSFGRGGGAAEFFLLASLFRSLRAEVALGEEVIPEVLVCSGVFLQAHLVSAKVQISVHFNFSALQFLRISKERSQNSGMAEKFAFRAISN